MIDRLNYVIMAAMFENSSALSPLRFVKLLRKRKCSAASLIFPVNIRTVLRQSVVGGKRRYELPFVLMAFSTRVSPSLTFRYTLWR